MSLPAVDGLNGKAEGFGGSLGGHSYYGAAGSISLPVAPQLGVQIDGLAGALQGDFLGGTGVHAFWRDPSRGLLGFYGDYLRWERLGSHVGHFGVEGAYYAGRFTLEGIAGVESGNNRTAVFGNVIEQVNLTTRFFDKVDLAYYLTDDLKLAIGHRYYGGSHSLALGGEWAFGHVSSASSSLFVEGRVGESSSVWGGLRVYFGQKPKSLIRRHREDDPTNNLGDSAGAFGNAGSSSPVPPEQTAGGLAPCGPGFIRLVPGGPCVPR